MFGVEAVVDAKIVEEETLRQSVELTASSMSRIDCVEP